MGWLSGWSYRKTVTITGEAGAGTDYQVDFSIGEAAGGDFNIESHCTSFPNDIQVTDNDQLTPLDYWVENLTVDPITMWVEVADDLGSNADVCVYYGKSGEASASNGFETFDFFDDFDSYTNGDLNSQGGWSGNTAFDVQSTIYQGVSGKAIENTVEDSGVKKIISHSITSRTNGTITYYIRTASTTQGYMGVALKEDTTTKLNVRVNNLDAHYLNSVGSYYAALPTPTSIAANNWYKFSFSFDASTDKYESIKIEDVEKTSGGIASLAFTGIDGIDIQSLQNPESNGNRFADLIILRKYNSPEPDFLSAGGETGGFVPYPLFSGMSGGISEALCGGIAR